MNGQPGPAGRNVHAAQGEWGLRVLVLVLVLEKDGAAAPWLARQADDEDVLCGNGERDF
jgi:hypothetical protein